MREPVLFHKHDEKPNSEPARERRRIERRQIRQTLEGVVNGSKNLVSGFMSAVVSKSVLAPLERIKMDMVLRHRKGVIPTLQVIVAEEGPRGLWKGNVANLLRIAPFKAINFLCYDLYRHALIRRVPGSKDELRVRERLLAGAMAGMTATITCFPLDLVRTRLLSSSAYSNPFGALRDVACKEGIGALYVGCLPAVVGMAPAGAVFYGSYDMLKYNHLHRWQAHAHSAEEGQQTLPAAYTLLYGGIAGILSECVVYPLEVVRRRMQLQSMAAATSAEQAAALTAMAQSRVLGRLRAAVMSIAQEQGPLGYYAGLVPNLAQVLPSAALSYFVYETCKRLLHVKD